MQVTSRCTTFTGQNDSEDWLAHISAVESDVAVLQSFSGDDHQRKAGGHWSILGSIPIAEEPADGEDGPSLDQIVTKLSLAGQQWLRQYQCRTQSGADSATGLGMTPLRTRTTAEPLEERRKSRDSAGCAGRRGT
eukprot:2097625-Rhodomonas_salina.1